MVPAVAAELELFFLGEIVVYLEGDGPGRHLVTEPSLLQSLQFFPSGLQDVSDDIIGPLVGRAQAKKVT